ncbi:hypothetical protein ACYSNO_10840 [Enterococcus sp. LJL98]
MSANKTIEKFQEIIKSEADVASLIESISEVYMMLQGAFDIEEGKSYEVDYYDGRQWEKVTESAFQRIQSLVAFVLERPLSEIVENLGIDPEEETHQLSKSENLEMYLGMIEETLSELQEDFTSNKTDDELFSKVSDIEDFLHDFKLTLDPEKEIHKQSLLMVSVPEELLRKVL